MQKLSSSLLLMMILIVPGSKVSVQKDARLPPTLNSNSSLAEILRWLDQNAFPYARVGLRSTGGLGYLTFTFDSKELAEQFNAAFRSAISICNSK